jgi:hypothetical protein
LITIHLMKTPKFSPLVLLRFTMVC